MPLAGPLGLEGPFVAHESRPKSVEVVVDLGADTVVPPDLLAYASMNGRAPVPEDSAVGGGAPEPFLPETEAIEAEALVEPPVGGEVEALVEPPEGIEVEPLIEPPEGVEIEPLVE